MLSVALQGLDNYTCFTCRISTLTCRGCDELAAADAPVAQNMYVALQCLNLCIIIIRLHCSTMYVDAAYRYRQSSMVCLSVCWPDCKPEGPLFSAEFVCVCVCVSVCL